MAFLYQIAFRLYIALAYLLSFFQPKAKKWLDGRRFLWQHLEPHFPSQRRVIWFHAASLGEFEQGRPLINNWKQTHPEDFILLTFFSPSGYEIRKNYAQADLVCYLPYDLRRLVRRFINLVNPKAVVFIKYEFWPVLLHTLVQRKIDIFVVSARFRPKQVFFRWYGKPYLKLLKGFTSLFVQDQESVDLLEKHHIHQVQLGGDTRVDQVIHLRDTVSPLPEIDAFIGDSWVLIGGSTWPPEEKLLHEFSRKYPQGLSGRSLKMIIAPHDVSKRRIREIQSNFGSAAITLSLLRQNRPSSLVIQPKPNILIIDEIGILSQLYQYAHVALIGGAFGKGLHNVLEPAAFGVAVLFGPRYQKFNEAIDILRKKGGFSISNFQLFDECILGLLGERKLYLTAGAECREFVDSQAGATELISSCLLENI